MIAFKPQPDIQAELKDAVDMLAKATIATDHLAPKLEFINLQTGTKVSIKPHGAEISAS